MIAAALAISMALSAGQYDRSWTPYDEADGKLTAAYDALAAHLSGANKLQLRDAERAWIGRRNAACGFEVKTGCATRFTVRRTAELEATLNATVTYRAMPDQQLLKLEVRMEDACRGGPEDADGPICRRRDKVVSQLESRGWCWGPDDADSEADRRWMRHGPHCRL